MNPKELESRLRAFAYRIVNVCDALPKKKISKVIEDQLLRSSFSAAANYRAACKGISKKSFVAKLSIAFEEADESLFWAEVIKELKLLPEEKLSSIIKEASELASILASARKTSQKSLKI
ncbi:MAG TPA: four helix bundle protein [Ferruginibacter sp.]|jgi:four helix bundle protein|nr:four helix bundle protein [Ferruginibacter sp.]